MNQPVGVPSGFDQVAAWVSGIYPPIFEAFEVSLENATEDGGFDFIGSEEAEGLFDWTLSPEDVA